MSIPVWGPLGPACLGWKRIMPRRTQSTVAREKDCHFEAFGKCLASIARCADGVSSAFVPKK